MTESDRTNPADRTDRTNPADRTDRTNPADRTNRASPADRTSAAEVLAAGLAELEVPHVREGDDAFLVTLPGERRHRTLVWLVVGAHDVLVESFVCRAPDEHHADVYRYLLQRNAKLRTVAYALDADGDIHLVGRLSVAGLDAAELDTLLGVVLATSDEDFNQILERGFASAIRREWAWRTSRGESVRNLEAFRHLIEQG